MTEGPQRLLDALSSPVRREILWMVWDQELAVGDIAAAFDVTAPTISQHLTVLRGAGLVTMRAEGNFRRYRARQDAFRGFEALLSHTGRWAPPDRPADDGVTVVESDVVALHVEVDETPAVAFTGFVEPDVYSRWLGVPVTLTDGRFACETERGIRVRGIYDVVSPPTLLAMRWDFDAQDVPVPADLRTAYLRVLPTATGSRVDVHQFVNDDVEARDMRDAWTSVLTRFRDGLTAALAVG
ncbi:MAG: metalloregulator ArsR/SmtB family transcription factor [Acidimicrobiales bacterium]